MREIRLSGSEGGGTKPIASPYPYRKAFWGGPRKAAKMEHQPVEASADLVRCCRLPSQGWTLCWQ